MKYIGIPNSRQKAELAEGPTARLLWVPTADLAFDCDRHIAFLRLAHEHPTYRSLLCTDYCRYLRSTGRTEQAAQERMQRFLKVYQAWHSKAPEEMWATVTEDGLRLDGSHRAAVAVVIGHPMVRVRVVAYRSTDAAWREEVLAWRAKRLEEKGMRE